VPSPTLTKGSVPPNDKKERQEGLKGRANAGLTHTQQWLNMPSRLPCKSLGSQCFRQQHMSYFVALSSTRSPGRQDHPKLAGFGLGSLTFPCASMKVPGFRHLVF
jgi:hypothetical protein